MRWTNKTMIKILIIAIVATAVIMIKTAQPKTETIIIINLIM